MKRREKQLETAIIPLHEFEGYGKTFDEDVYGKIEMHKKGSKSA